MIFLRSGVFQLQIQQLFEFVDQFLKDNLQLIITFEEKIIFKKPLRNTILQVYKI